jgi:hypothetical protein
VSHRPFRDRRDVGRVLAGLLGEYRGRSDVIPRGGVPVAHEVATALGAIASGGVTVINDDVARGLTKRSGTSFARLARDWFTRHLHAGRPRPEAPEEGNSRS